ARGRELFFGRARCSDCHTVAGQGGFFGSELIGVAAKKSSDELRKAILAPDAGRDPRKGPVTVTLANGSILTGMPRNEDNFSLQLQTPDGSFHMLQKTAIVSLTRSSGSIMSADHGLQLSTRELNDLMGFLMQSSGAQQASNSRKNTDDEE